MPDRSFLYRSGTEYRWRRQSANGLEVAGSTEGYRNKADAASNYERTSGPDAPTLEDLTDEDETATD